MVIRTTLVVCFLLLGVLIAPSNSFAEFEKVGFCRIDFQQNPPEIKVSTRSKTYRKFIATLKQSEVLRKRLSFWVPRIYSKFHQLKGRKYEQRFFHFICAHYADNPSVLRAWNSLLAKVSLVREKKAFELNPEDLWQGLNGETYRHLIWLDRAINHYKVTELAQEKSFTHGEAFQPSLSPLSNCELKFIFQKYVSRMRPILTLQDYELYKKEYGEYSSSEANCSEADFNYGYIFRGIGGSLGHWSIDSGASRYFSRKLIERCLAKVGKESECLNYQKTPWFFRQEYSYAALRRLLFSSSEHDERLQKLRKLIVITDDTNGDGVLDMFVPNEQSFGGRKFVRLRDRYYYRSKRGRGRKDPALEIRTKRAWNRFNEYFVEEVAPGSASVPLKTSTFWSSAFSGRGDQGFSHYFPLDTPEQRLAAWRKLVTVLDRNADYYDLDFLSLDGEEHSVGFTPWVTGSASIAQAHKYTFQGFWLNTQSKMEMNWMLVFKVPLIKIYTAKKLEAGVAPNFANNWFDTRTLTTSGLGNEELAYDFLGSIPLFAAEALLWLGDVEVTPELVSILETETHSS